MNTAAPPNIECVVWRAQTTFKDIPERTTITIGPEAFPDVPREDNEDHDAWLDRNRLAHENQALGIMLEQRAVLWKVPV